MLSPDACSIFAQPNMAHLAVVDEAGRPHVTPVWVDVDDQDRLVVNTAVGRVKDRYLQVGDSVALSVLHPENPYQYVQARGAVIERTTDDGDAVIDQLANKYLGVDTYPFRQEGEQRVTVRIQPSAVTGM